MASQSAWRCWWQSWALCCGSLAEQTASSRPEEEEGLRVESNPINPADQVQRTGLVVVLVLVKPPALRKGLRVHISELSHGSTNFRETWFFFGNLARGCLATPGAAVAMAVRRAIPLRSRQVVLECFLETQDALKCDLEGSCVSMRFALTCLEGSGRARSQKSGSR